MKKKCTKLFYAAELMGLMAHPVRLSMLCNLAAKGEMNVTDIVEAEMGAVSQSHASQFLARMRKDGFVSARKDGQTVYYRLQSKEAKKMIEAIQDIFL